MVVLMCSVVQSHLGAAKESRSWVPEGKFRSQFKGQESEPWVCPPVNLQHPPALHGVSY